MARRSKQYDPSTRDDAVSRSGVDRAHTSAPPSRWTWQIRALISAAIAYHLAAVFIGAWVGSPPTSPFADEVARPFRAYIAAVDLNHGYRFFAPNPGPSHIFRYRLMFEDGSTAEGYFPNRNEHWPRLLYHRYFMLSENLNAVRMLTLSPDEDEAAGEARFRALGNSYAGQILRARGAERIDWELVRHYQATPEDVLAGRSLLNVTLYEPVGSGTISREDLP
jgi:hypothetical protein